MAKKRQIESTHLTVQLAAESIHVNPAFILANIASGKLKASNISTGTQRPRWRIAKSDLEKFMARRCNKPKAKPRRKSSASHSVPNYV